VEVLDAYAAGLIDGEGTITLSRDHPQKRRFPVVSVTSTTPELLEPLFAEYGGHVRVHRTYSERHSDSFIWSVRYDRAIRMLQRIRPYLRVHEKQRRTDLILCCYKRLTPRNGKYTADQLCARLDFEHDFFHPSTP
jgi:hypothetical protein